MDWQPIENCPFEKLSYRWHECVVLFTDGIQIAVGMVCGPGSQYDEETDDYYMGWDINDAMSDDHELYGRDRISFKPTHYMIHSPPSCPKSDKKPD